MGSLLIAFGVVGALLDILLHVLQLHDIPVLRTLQKRAAGITLVSATLIGLSLFAQFNAGALVMDLFITFLALTSIFKNSATNDQPKEHPAPANEQLEFDFSPSPYDQPTLIFRPMNFEGDTSDLATDDFAEDNEDRSWDETQLGFTLNETLPTSLELEAYLAGKRAMAYEWITQVWFDVFGKWVRA